MADVERDVDWVGRLAEATPERAFARLSAAVQAEVKARNAQLGSERFTFAPDGDTYLVVSQPKKKGWHADYPYIERVTFFRANDGNISVEEHAVNFTKDEARRAAQYTAAVDVNCRPVFGMSNADTIEEWQVRQWALERLFFERDLPQR